jgi:PAS domain S-box-containing protein
MQTKLTDSLDPAIENAQRIQAAHMLSQVAISIAVLATIFYGLMLFVAPTHALRWLLTMGAVNTATIVVFYLVRRNVVWLARVVIFLLMWGIVTTLCLTGGGLRSPIFPGYLCVIFASGVFFSKRAGIAAMVWCGLTAFVMVWLEQAGMLSPQPIVTDSVLLWWNFVSIAGFVAALQYVAVQKTDNVLRIALNELANRQRIQTSLQERVAQYSALTSNALDGFVIVGRDGHILDANAAYAEMTGFSRAELQTMTMMALDPDEAPDAAARHRSDIIAKGSERFMARHRCKDGRIIEIEVSATFVPESACIASFVRDVTASQQAQVALRESEERFHTLAELCPAGIYLTNARGECIYTNQRWCDMAGMTYDQAAGQGWIQGLHADDRSRVAAAWEHMIESKGKWGLEYRFKRPDGRISWVLGVATASHNEHGELTGYIGANVDIGDLKQAEEALRERDLFNRTVLDSLTANIAVLDANGDILATNRNWDLFAQQNGASEKAGAFIGANYLSECRRAAASGDESARQALYGLTAIFAGETTSFSLEYPCDSPDQKRWFVLQATAMQGGNGSVVIVHEDVSERKRSDEEVRRKTEEIDRFFSLSRDLFCISDHDGHFITMNPAWEETLHYPRAELMAHSFLDFVHPSDLAATRQAMAVLAGQQEVSNFVNRYRAKNGDHHWLEWRAVPGGAVVYAAARDITRRKQAEQERERMLAQLRVDQEQLHALSRRILDVQESERRHIARELHDEIGQSLTVLKMLIERRDLRLDDGLTPRLSDALSMLGQLIATVRDLSLDLRPAMLDDLGLLPALLWFLDRFSAQTHVEVSFHHGDIAGRRFGTIIETAAYRIVQEALTNVALHAAINAATVRVWTSDRILNILVADEGQGFDVRAALATGEASGLAGMQERATLLDGHVTIESTPGGGTQVSAQIPLSGSTERGADDDLDRTG